MKKIVSFILVALTAIILVACDDKDLVKPVISGTKDYELILGQDKPDFKAGVTALDDVDGTLLVNVDDTNLDLEKPGKYSIIYTATDKSGNIQTVIQTVTITNNDVRILGTKDHVVTVGEELPDFNLDVTATDSLGEALEVIVDSAHVKTDEAGSYTIYYKVLDENQSIVAIKQQKVEVSYKQEVTEITNFIKNLDVSNLFKENTHLSLEISIPDIVTPYDPTSLPFGMLLKDMVAKLDIYTNLNNYQEAEARGILSVTIPQIEMIVYQNGGSNYMQTTGTPDNPGSWISNNVIEYDILIKSGKLYVSFESEMNFGSNKMTVIELLNQINSDPMFSNMIPNSAKPIIEMIQPIITDHKEVQNYSLPENIFNEITDVLSMVQFVPSLINEKLINDSVFDMSLENNILSIKDINLKKVVPMVDMLLPMIGIDNPILLALINGNINISLLAHDNQFDTLSIDASIGEYEVTIKLSNYDISLPDKLDEKAFVVVDETTLIKTIRSLFSDEVKSEV